MHPQVGHLTAPAHQMRLKLRPAAELPPSDRIPLDVGHPPLVLAFCPGPVRPTGTGLEPPVGGELLQPLGKNQDVALGIVLAHQRTGVIHQHLFGHPAPVAEALLQGLEPVVLLLAAECPHQQPARVTQGQHRQVHPHPLAADAHQALAKVCLQLTARRGLKPHRRQGRVAQLPTPRLHGTLHCAQAHLDSLLAGQLLPHHIGIAAVGQKPLPQPVPLTVENRVAAGLPVGLPATLPQVLAHRLGRAAQLPGNPPPAPASC